MPWNSQTPNASQGHSLSCFCGIKWLEVNLLPPGGDGNMLQDFSPGQDELPFNLFEIKSLCKPFILKMSLIYMKMTLQINTFS